MTLYRARYILSIAWAIGSVGVMLLLFTQESSFEREATDVYGQAVPLWLPYLSMIVTWAVASRKNSKARKVDHPPLFWIAVILSTFHFAIITLAVLRDSSRPMLDSMQSAARMTGFFSALMLPILTAFFVNESRSK